MSKKLVIIVVLLSLAVPAWGAAAQDSPLVIWQALSADDNRVLQAAARPFADEMGLALELQYVDAAYLPDEMLAARQAGVLPDVVLAGSEMIDPLMGGDLITPLNVPGDFFLINLLESMPGLRAEFCEDPDAADCLWPGASPMLPLPPLDDEALARTVDWVCQSSPWMPFCSGDSLAGLPVSWGYQIYLINDDWLAENGLKAPATMEDLADMRAKYRLTFVYAEPDFMPRAEDVNPTAIYVIDSMLVAENPNALMESMGSFHQAGYVPVLWLRVDSAYVSASPNYPDEARAMVEFLAGNVDMKIDLFRSSHRLLAVDAGALSARGMDSDAARVTLQALEVLVAYARLAY